MLKNNLCIVVDENIPAAQEMFGEFGHITRFDGRTLTAKILTDADVLLVRSVTQVNRQLLENTAVKFVGSATIGVDHIDLEYLEARGIKFSSAPGCNADAVVEYDLNCISEILAQKSEQLRDKIVAIIGVGNVGGRLAKRLSGLGVQEILLNDPPRSTSQPGFTSLEHCLRTADVIAMHTPLTTVGEWPTKHLLSLEQLHWLKPQAILLNAGRGGAIKADDLLAFLKVRPDVKTILDVWEHEPFIDKQLADRVDIATAHIAGHTVEGKIRGTFMLKQAFCKYLNITCKEHLDHYLPVANVTAIDITQHSDCVSLMRVMYDPFRDDRALRATLAASDQALQFDLLRKHYPNRREFYSLQVKGQLSDSKRQLISNYGFSLQKSNVGNQE